MKRLTLLFFVAIASVACNPTNDNPQAENKVELATPIIDATASSQWVTISTEGEWSATIEYTSDETGWAALDKTEGEGNALVRLNYLRNTKNSERTLNVVVTFSDNSTKSATLKQGAGQSEPGLPTENSVSLETYNVTYKDGRQNITIMSDVAWTATLFFDNGDPEWATLEEISGNGDKIIGLRWNINNSTKSRSVKVEVAFDDGETLNSYMSQTGVGENKLQLSTTNIAYNSDYAIDVTITSEVAWTATLQYGSGASDWASLSKNGGSGSDLILLYPTANASQNQRTVTVSVSFAVGGTLTATLTQTGVQGTDPPISAPGWTELPKVVKPNDNDYYFVTHYAPLNNGQEARNYTILYDATKYVAMWIAYPMSKAYATGSAGGRNESWTYDPKIPTAKQVNLSKSYGASSDAGIYSRGHQVASSDRQSTKAQNRQTFYYTNMTPQKQDFNGVIWNYLEQNIQDLAKSISDTLWCVTGPVFQTVGGNEPIDYISKDGKSCPIPNYYYKIIIRKSGNTYKGIGFWFGHNYNYSISHFKDGPSMSDVKKIRDIEALTGIDFYTNLSQADQDAAENQSVDSSYWSALFGK